jgi:FtsP/CotA-like multicopper oxidase with cupredoxin domain
MNNLNRRRFLSLAGATLGSALLNTRVSAQASITTSSLPELPLVPTKRLSPNLVEASITALPTNTVMAGQRAQLWTYNGSVRGSVLRVREGDTVHLKFVNQLPEATNLHLHGLHVSPEVDNPLAEVAPGETVKLEFEIPKSSAGTYWFHPHMHGMVAKQMFAGLAGVIVVEGVHETLPELREAEERIIVLRDLELVNGLPAQHTMMDWMNGKEGNLLLVNGAIKPILNAQKSTLRLRLLNASNARYYRLKLEGHPMHLIATDGGLIEKPVMLEELLLAPGERAEVLVRLEREGVFKLLNLPYNRGKMMMGGMSGGRDSSNDSSMGGMSGMGSMMGSTTQNTVQSSQTLLSVVAPKNPKPLPLPTALATVPAIDVHQAVTRRIVMTEKMRQMRFFLNGKAFDPKRVDISAKLGDTEVWELVNKSDMDHPFHLHTYPFQVLSRNGKPEPYRAWKDVVNLRKNDIVRIAIPLTDFEGKTVYHCHLLEHEDKGMMGVLEVKGRG